MNYQLYHGDCLEIMPTLEPGSVDAIIADLPYQKIFSSWDILIPLEPLWEQYRRLIKPRGIIILFGGQPFTSILVMSNPNWFRQELIWDKGQGGSFALANKRILPSHENILLFYQSLPTYNPQFTKKPIDKIRPPRPMRNHNSKIAPMASGKSGNSQNFDRSRSYPVSILRYSSVAQECNSQNRHHPTQKPVALLEYLVKTYTNPGDTVLDNTMGSASTGEACLRTGRNFIGIELYPLPGLPTDDKDNPPYFQIATDRMERVAAELRGEYVQPKATESIDTLPLFQEQEQ